ncbi:MscS Mechanosensitive ion channel [Sulfurimonas denitrificans DSM 1251]|uniref:MscS Mechanosensitive ion channel n=1 Tax=Sulfurimonas denitrificans (strain ATCC 33889 / DSM 1251) TaxID=326298 RepID=Q30UK3_SULDN|nr:mechanosensitive ion channel domain-containing protein [Sulfurimonas denitrificans]ABB43328.1 MscS Mechanosensitive ion channel [Sulfurimonas denitrificans DSM 1251]MDD3442320.1 mechanosensitive ion channel [Sulfurimonas denitrificans]
MDISKYSDLTILYISEYGLKALAAIVIFFIGKFIIKKITSVIKKIMISAKVDLTLVEFLSKVIYFALFIVVILTSLNTLGINTTSFLAIFGAASLAIGLALKDSLSNIGAAVLIIIFRPFRVGDVIDAADTSGKVEEINLFSTILATPDNKTVMVPNSSIINSTITNYSNKPTRRVTLSIGVGYNDDLKFVKETLQQIIKEDERVLKEPEPLVAVSELAQSSVNFTFRVWVSNEDFWSVNFDMLEKIKTTFDEKGISIPFPQMDIHTKKD